MREIIKRIVLGLSAVVVGVSIIGLLVGFGYFLAYGDNSLLITLSIPVVLFLLYGIGSNLMGD